MDPGDVWILYRRELRSALRERSIVVNSILLPIVLYPVLLWVMFSAIVFVEGLAEGFVSRVALEGVPARHGALVDTLAAMESVEVLGGGDAPVGEEEARRRVADGDLDAWVRFGPAGGEGSALGDNATVRILYDRSVERSRRARERVEGVLEAYRSRWLADEARARGAAEAARRPFLVEPHNVATSREMGTLLLAEMVPLFLVIMVALGCFVPSVDTTAGERERSTWETLMTVSASRTSVVVAKYLYVATLGIAGGVLNVVAVFLSIGAVVRPLLGGREEFTFSLPPAAVPVMILGAVALALLFSAAMMILAAFARTFKEGQGMVTPIYWLALLPLLLGSDSERNLTPALAAVPVANVAMVIKDALRGVFLWPWIGETLLVTLAMVALCLWTARRILGFEDVLLGDYDGSFWRFARTRLLPGGSR